jgi:hypothetical protein
LKPRTIGLARFVLSGGRKVSCCGLVERSYGEVGTAAQSAANREEKKSIEVLGEGLAARRLSPQCPVDSRHTMAATITLATSMTRITL